MYAISCYGFPTHVPSELDRNRIYSTSQRCGAAGLGGYYVPSGDYRGAIGRTVRGAGGGGMSSRAIDGIALGTGVGGLRGAADICRAIAAGGSIVSTIGGALVQPGTEAKGDLQNWATAGAISDRVGSDVCGAFQSSTGAPSKTATDPYRSSETDRLLRDRQAMLEAQLAAERARGNGNGVSTQTLLLIGGGVAAAGLLAWGLSRRR
jgi:hypothetical protein